MANDRDCENCIHKINGACKVWECKFEPKRGMTKEEAIEIIECGEISNRWGKDGEEVEKMAIEALKQKPSISEDGTLTVNIEDGSKVSRVLVCGDNHFGGLYYPEQEPCDKCVYSTSEGCQYDDITETIPPFETSEDAINRAELLKAIDTWDKFGYTETGCFVREPKNDCVKYIHYDDVIECIKDMPPVNPQKPCKDCQYKEWLEGEDLPSVNPKQSWIPVSERLPNFAGTYLVTRYFPNNVMNPTYLVDACFFDGTDTWHNDNRINHERKYLTNVVAWLEEPEPYKAEGSEE